MRKPFATPKSTASFRIAKSARILKSADFRKVYAEGARISGPCFAAFCLEVQRPDGEGPRLGFTVPRAFGRAVSRNRVKRRLRDALRRRLSEIDPRWDVVINPRRLALNASPQDIQQSLDRLISQCGKR